VYIIYQVVDPATGEVIRYTADLADQVQELVRLRSQAQVARQLAALDIRPRPILRPAPADPDAQIWRLFHQGDV
jgi:hypothetical protein